MQIQHTANGGMAIHGKVQNQLVFNANGTLSSATKPDLKTADHETLATVGTLREMNRMPLFFNGWHDGPRAGLVPLYAGAATPQDGVMLSALTHPAIAKGVLAGHVASCSETEWQADANKRGMWSRGTAYLDGHGNPQGWVRLPDRNGVQPGSLPAQFWRGGADAKAGIVGRDTMRNITGSFLHVAVQGNHSDSFPPAPNAFYGPLNVAGGAVSPSMGGGPDGSKRIFAFDASKALPAGATTDPITGEFAPWHVFGCYYTITSNGVVNEGALDAAGLSAEMLLLQGRVTTLEGRQKAVGDGQSWQDVTANRVSGTTYTNTTGRTIAVAVSQSQGTGAVTGYVGGGVVIQLSEGADSNQVVHLIVPSGLTYSVTAQLIQKWMELR